MEVVRKESATYLSSSAFEASLRRIGLVHRANEAHVLDQVLPAKGLRSRLLDRDPSRVSDVPQRSREPYVIGIAVPKGGEHGLAGVDMRQQVVAVRYGGIGVVAR